MGYLIPDFKRPACGRKLLAKEFKAGKPWTCSDCSRQFRTSRTYKRCGAGASAHILPFSGGPWLAAFSSCCCVLVSGSAHIDSRALPNNYSRLEPYQPVRLDNDLENADPKIDQSHAAEKKTQL